jgi:predicted aconitase
MTRLLLLLASSVALAGTVHAGELKPIAAESINLGQVTGVAYYTVEQGGLKLVATLAPAEAATPVRISTVLAPGQSISVGVPGPQGDRETLVSFSRQGDRIVTARGEAAAY